ncbi:GIY-YIG nuclease family protein [Methanococcoides seepicolus]|uniref:GIY-YIG nuclease family protein n=1 Tax=Methanococcoides seepicolus TaxID=2828780 RepID=A0A9E5D9X7_9EURY|nr:GIY-YIG nuclease family protein [Methanococcoides seepicolus]MCM1986290.1 GIY-YIG nuclease family protein [Methanococcoides seepicolus]
MDKNEALQGIFDSDSLGLLDVKPKRSSASSSDERLITSFQEINEFFEKHKREPQPNREDISEHILYCRLKAFREDEENNMACQSLDKYGLLKDERIEINSIDDIFRADELNLLGGDSEGLFDFKHVPKETNMPDYVASRRKCTDFEDFEPLFIKCQSELSNKKRRLYPFKNEQDIKQGHFFVLKGVLLYVDYVGEKISEKGKINARLRCIFENGTESDMLLRSLSAELYKNGRRVSENEDGLFGGSNAITEEDKETGSIYILKSLSSNPKIQNISNLYKIGYSNISVEERIKNAEQEPTYLMAPVKIVSEFKCYNLNSQKLEQLTHTFFGKVCLNFDIFDKNKIRHSPREWFIAPLDVIEETIEFIISGDIIDYRYDSEREMIVAK